ncbi:hypothetical protein SteCoe_10152 [Stentor coeruleus]|uniref:Uncharacterized protein n=1 Tax=Stentor coeruleus TaxID=5963 RepID=A0A1R2CG46_9CILI|nr:hypothetical protein SteCoe_10152 [Stentor coeruleus]
MNYTETEDNVIVKKTLTYSRIKFSKPETIKVQETPQHEPQAQKIPQNEQKAQKTPQEESKARKNPQDESKVQKTPQHEPKAIKRKVDESTKPLKKIKFYSKPQYDFIDSQAEGITPCINQKVQSRTKGQLSSAFSTFVNRNPTCKIKVKVLSVKSEYGTLYISVDVGQTEIPKIRGKMTLLYRGNLKLSNTLTVNDPKVVVIDNTEYLFAKEVIPVQ